MGNFKLRAQCLKTCRPQSRGSPLNVAGSLCSAKCPGAQESYVKTVPTCAWGCVPPQHSGPAPLTPPFPGPRPRPPPPRWASAQPLRVLQPLAFKTRNRASPQPRAGSSPSPCAFARRASERCLRSPRGPLASCPLGPPPSASRHAGEAAAADAGLLTPAFPRVPAVWDTSGARFHPSSFRTHAFLMSSLAGGWVPFVFFLFPEIPVSSSSLS